jgi:hypothetical protein
MVFHGVLKCIDFCHGGMNLRRFASCHVFHYQEFTSPVAAWEGGTYKAPLGGRVKEAEKLIF